MSGPKVVRIVTREEVLALCNAELARVDAAMRDWASLADRGEGLSEEERAAVSRRRAELAALIAVDRFMDFQKAAEREIAFLASDSQVRLARIAEAKAAAATAARRNREAARALANALRAKGIAMPKGLEQRLQAVAAGSEDQAAMAEGFAALSPDVESGADERRRLAALHRTGASSPSLADWMTGQPMPADEARLVKVDRRLAELQAVGGAAPALLAAREAAEGETNAKRRALLLDSLELDLAGIIAAAKGRAALETELNLALAALRSLSPAAHEALEARRLVLGGGDGLVPLLSDVKAAAEEARAFIAADARREAVLQVLHGLGYEVTEGMETAWAKDGQVVLRNAARPDYGVEIIGQGQAERLQMRCVAFEDGDAGSPHPQRDRDAETLWCGEVGALRAALARSGGDLDIVKARAIGEVALKRVKSARGQERRATTRKPKLRTAD